MCLQIQLIRDPTGAVTLVQEKQPPVEVHPTRLFPITEPMRHIVLKDNEGQEILTIGDIEELDPASMSVLRLELDRIYFLPRIKHILSITESMGIVHFSVETDKGAREFEIRHRDDIRYLHNRCLQIILKDIDGNRFEIWDPARMDPRSRSLMDRFL